MRYAMQIYIWRVQCDERLEYALELIFISYRLDFRFRPTSTILPIHFCIPHL